MRIMVFLMLAGVVTSGCKAKPGDGRTLTDLDGDGHEGEYAQSTNPTDCDDNDPAINPDATEVCDKVDNDCDGGTDNDPADGTLYYPDADGDLLGDINAEGRNLCEPPDDGNWSTDNSDCDDLDAGRHGEQYAFYPDADGDGAPVDGTVITACFAPEGYARNLDGWDCDDSNPDVYPGAEEDCNGIDDDCDGLVDIDDPSLEGTGRWYLDSDRDGYGRDDDYVLACEEQPGRVTLGGDCNDRNADISPGEDEVPYDGIDNDCADGDECDLDGDGYAYVECPAGGDDCIDDPTWREAMLTAAMVNPGAEEDWYDGVDQDCSGGSDYDQDGDGYACDVDEAAECADAKGVYDCESDPDVVGCGDCEDLDADVSPGHWELPGTSVDEDCDGHVDKVVVDESTHLAATYGSPGSFGISDRVGTAILPLGDVGGDGYDDYLISAPRYSTARGVVDLVSGAAASSTTGPRGGTTSWYGYDTGLGAGASLDIYLDSRGAVGGYLIAGSDEVWLAPTSGSFSTFTPSITTFADCLSSAPPMTVTQIGNALFAVADPDCRYVSTFVGPISGTLELPSSDARVNFTSSAGQLGRRLASGEIDGASGSKPDLVMTAESEDVVAYALLGDDVDFAARTSGYVNVEDDGLKFEHSDCGVDEDHARGLAVLDFDGDGTDDIAIGCPGFDDRTYENGAVFIVQGRTSISDVDLSTAKWVFYGVGGSLGASVSSAGDVDTSVAGEELLVTDPTNRTVYLLNHSAPRGSSIDDVSLEFETSTSSIPIHAAGVGNTNGADGADIVLSFQTSGAASEAYLLTWGP